MIEKLFDNIDNIEELRDFLNNMLLERKENELWETFWKRKGINLWQLPNWGITNNSVYLDENLDDPYSWDKEGNMLFYDYLYGFYVSHY